MGILNVTPDSFLDGGLYFDRQAAVDKALQMGEDGADIIDIGGESTRPGAEPVSLDEELRRTIPVIESLSERLSIPISIDTYKSAVAQKAIEAGASIVNDISGLRFDPEMAPTLSKYDIAVIVMHIKGTPRDMQKNPVYADLFKEITDYISGSIKIAKENGISEEKIIIDPGIGFGKTPEDNLKIIKNLKKFSPFSRPILIGVSRKSFIGKILNDAPPSERIEGTSAAVAISVLNGANIIRVHDVKEMLPVVKVAHAIRNEAIYAVTC